MQEILSFQIQHKKPLLEIFDSNVPEFFALVERKPFEKFLNKPIGDYFVLTCKDEIMGAGGFCKESEGEARICWLMVHRKMHTEGIGRQLMEYFEKQISLQAEYSRITLKTTQTAKEFYSKLGYRSTYFEKNHWAKGLDLYFMEKGM